MSERENTEARIDLSYMLEKWPSAIVARPRVDEFTGGMIAPGYLANLDSQGEGPDGRFKIGRKTGYSAVKLVRWLQGRARAIRRDDK